MSDTIDAVLRARRGELGAEITEDELSHLMAARGILPLDPVFVSKAQTIIGRLEGAGELAFCERERQVLRSGAGYREFVPYHDDPYRSDYVHPFNRVSGEQGHWRTTTVISGGAHIMPQGAHRIYETVKERYVTAPALAESLLNWGDEVAEFKSSALLDWLTQCGAMPPITTT